MKLNIKAVATSVFFLSFSASSLSNTPAITDCHSSILLKDLKVIVDKKTGDSFVNSQGEKWTMGSEGHMLKTILDYLNDPTKVNITIGTRLTSSHHGIKKSYHGADLTETISCGYTLYAGGPNTNQTSGITLLYTAPSS